MTRTRLAALSSAACRPPGAEQKALGSVHARV
jgi:hypothetical protein